MTSEGGRAFSGWAMRFSIHCDSLQEKMVALEVVKTATELASGDTSKRISERWATTNKVMVLVKLYCVENPGRSEYGEIITRQRTREFWKLKYGISPPL